MVVLAVYKWLSISGQAHHQEGGQTPLRQLISNINIYMLCTAVANHLYTIQ